MDDGLFAQLLGVKEEELQEQKVVEKLKQSCMTKKKEERENLVLAAKASLIRESEHYRCKINMSNDLIQMLDIALKCISELTGERLFYESNKRKLKEAVNGVNNYAV